MKSHPSRFTIAYLYDRYAIFDWSLYYCCFFGCSPPPPTRFLVTMQHAPSLSSATKTLEAS